MSQSYELDGVPSKNLWVQINGTKQPDEIVLLGAHYDSVMGSPGANDNASGVAALLEISGIMQKASAPHRSVRFVAFTNEEPPFFMTGRMGSQVYARKAAKDREKIVAMMSLETIGYYTDTPGSQTYPPLFGLFYPNKGNFIGFVGNLSSRDLVKRVKNYFSQAVDFPYESITAPRFVPGVDWSDHASFWDAGYHALMVTDTALYRYPEYHQATDTPENLNYPAFAKVVGGLAHVTSRLANEL